MKHLILFSLLSFFTISASAQGFGGCNYYWSCNYDPYADYYVEGTCDFSCYGIDFTIHACISGFGCMEEDAVNYDPEAMYNTISDCIYPEEDIDFNDDGVIGAADLVVFLSYYGGEWP